jgi:hypothetical protein
MPGTEYGGSLISPVGATAINLDSRILIQTDWFALSGRFLKIFDAAPEHSRRIGLEAVSAGLTMVFHKYL